MNSLIVLLVSVLAVANAQIPGLGACPTNVTVKSDLDTGKFAGKWYQYEKYFTAFEAIAKCAKTEFIDLFVSYVVITTNSDFLSSVATTQYGVAVSTGPRNVGNLIQIFPAAQAPVPLPFSIVQTDYTNYAVIYSCVDVGFANLKLAYVMTRSRTPSAAVLAQAYAVMDANKIDRGLLMKTDQTNCPANH